MQQGREEREGENRSKVHGGREERRREIEGGREGD